VTKVTFTSGTTGEPRGVMLGWHHLEGVVDSLARAVGVRREDRLVALMLLAVLLENVGTLYAALWAGATVVLPSVAETGLLGAAGLDAGRLHATLTDYRATIAVFAPQVLQGLVEHIEAGAQAPRALRFAAVGGHRSRPACSAARPPSACPCSKATDSRSARRSCA
jgi:long-subunit acyl-CoA synthetase (AMP-forming)